VGGKSKSVTVGYKYYVGQHHVLCHGPIDNISRILVDERIAWYGTQTGGQINVQAAELFGGESREGGVSGLVDIEMGAPSQGQNSYLVSQLGSDVPGYRGVVGAVLRQCYLGNNPYLKAWAYRGQRVHKRQHGIAQWYDAKAAIQSSAVLAYNDRWEYQITGIVTSAPATVPSSGWNAPARAPFGSGFTGGGISPDLPYPINTNWPHTTGIWMRRTISLPFSGAVTFHGHIENACYLYIDGKHVYSFNAGNGQIVLSEWSFTMPSLDAGEHTIAIYATDDTTQSGDTFVYCDIPDQVDMNPVHIIRECLTDPDWGMGYQDADIDAPSFQAAADKLAAEQLGISLLWDKQMTIEAFVAEVVKHIDAALYVSRTTGKFVLKLIRDDFDPGTLLHLNESNIAKITNPKTPGFGELTNSVTVQFWDGATGKDSSITVQDTALIQMQGAVIGTTVQYPGFSNSRNGAIAAQRDLRSLSFPLFSCTVYANRDAKDLNIGDVFKLSWGAWKISEMVMRISAIAFGDGKSSQVRITCVQDIFSTPTVQLNQSSGGAWVDPSRPPTDSQHRISLEAPYLELVQALGEGDINSTLSGKSDIGYVMGAASNAANAINGRMWTDNGSGYQDVGGFDFCPYAELADPVGKKDTALTFTGGLDLDQVEVGTWCQIGTELMRVDGINTGTSTLTVGRGVLDTVPVAHAAGEDIYFWDQFSGYDPTEYVEGEEIDVKLQAVSGAGVVPLTSITAQTVEIEARAWRPYAPGDLKINGDSYIDDSSYEGELTVTWAHRDRLQQTSGTLADHFDGDIGPEPGTTYRIQVYIDGDLEDTIDDVDGNSAPVTPPGSGLVRIEVHAKRDGVYSWQAPWHEFYYGGDLRLTEGGDFRVTEDGDLRVLEA